MAARRTYVHIGATLGSQLTVMGLQFVYLAIVSRILAPTAFGAYAVAVLVTTLGNLIAATGLGQATARRIELSRREAGSLVSAGLVVGVSIAVVTAATAPLWGALWRNEDSVPLIIAMSLAVPAVAMGGVQRGLLRRRLRSPDIARATLTANATGLVVGLGCVVVWRSPIALCVAPVLTAVLAWAIMWRQLGEDGRPRALSRRVWPDLVFGGKSSAGGVLTYFTYGVPVWSLGAVLGPSVLGNWNRAVAIGQVPVDAVTSSVGTVVFHRFADTQTVDRRMRTELLRSSVIMVLPITSILVPLVPDVVRVVLGGQWDLAPLMAPWLVLAAAITLQSSILVMALEALGQFRRMYLGQFAGAFVLLGAAVGVALWKNWLLVPVAFVLASVVIHMTQVLSCSVGGLLDGRRLIGPYLGSTLVAVGLLGEAALVHRFFESPISLWINAGVLLLVAGSVYWSGRRRWTLAPHRWGLPPGE